MKCPLADVELAAYLALRFLQRCRLFFCFSISGSHSFLLVILHGGKLGFDSIVNIIGETSTSTHSAQAFDGGVVVFMSV